MSERQEKPTELLSALDSQTHEQRETLRTLLCATQRRLRPASLTQEAGNRALDFGLDTMDKTKSAIRAHPGTAVGAAALVGAIVARKPLWRLLRQGFFSLQKKVRKEK